MGKSIWMFVVSLLLCYSSFSSAVDIERIKVMGVNPHAGQAVIKFEDNKMQVVNVGDVIGDTEALLIQVLPDKLICNQPSSNNKSISDELWIYRVKGATEFSKIERFEKTQSLNEQINQPTTKVSGASAK